MDRDATVFFTYKGVTFKRHENNDTEDRLRTHINNKRQHFVYKDVIFYPALNIGCVVAYFPFREAGTWWIIDETNFDDELQYDFFEDYGPFETLNDALDEYIPLLVMQRMEQS